MEEYISSPGNDAQDLFTDGLHLTEEVRLIQTISCLLRDALLTILPLV